MDNSSEPHSPLNEEFAKLRKFLIFIYLPARSLSDSL